MLLLKKMWKMSIGVYATRKKARRYHSKGFRKITWKILLRDLAGILRVWNNIEENTTIKQG